MAGDDTGRVMGEHSAGGNVRSCRAEYANRSVVLHNSAAARFSPHRLRPREPVPRDVGTRLQVLPICTGVPRTVSAQGDAN